MTTSLMSCFFFSRRALAAIRSIPWAGVSSMNSLARLSTSPAVISRSMSSEPRWPLRSLWLSTRAWAQSSRSASSTRACSRLTKNTPAGAAPRTGSPTMMLRTMFRAIAVLPTDGRAARMISSLLCSPAVNSSMSTKPGRQAGLEGVLGPGVDPLVGVVDRFLQRDVLAGDAQLGHFEDLPFGVAEQFVGRLGLVVGVAEDFVAGVDQVADDRLFADDLGVILDVGRRRGRFPQLGEIGIAADVLDVFLLPQPFGQRDQVDRVGFVVEGEDALVDLLVGVEVEVFGADELDDVVDDDVVAKHAAEEAALGVPAMRRGAFVGHDGDSGICSQKAKANSARGRSCRGSLE